MKTEKLLSSTMLAAIALVTLDLKRGLPAPRRYVAIFVLWLMLGLVAQGSPNAARAASRFSMLVLLTMAIAVAGKLIGFLDLVAKAFPLQPAPLTSSSDGQAPPQEEGQLT